MIDSSKWSVIEAGPEVRAGQAGRAIRSRSRRARPSSSGRHALARRYGAAVVVMAFDEKGQADTLERRIEISPALLPHPRRTRSACRPRTSSSIRTSSPSPPASRSTTTTAVDFIEATRWISANLPHVKISGGVSNLSFSFRGNDPVREAMHTAFLYHAIRRRHDDGHRQRRAARRLRGDPDDLLERVEDVILNRRSRRHRAAGGVRRDGEGARQDAGGGARLAQGHGRGAPRARAREGHRRLDRRGHRGGAAAVRAADPRDRRAAAWTA